MEKTRRSWDRGQIVTAIQDWARAHDGEPPKADDWRLSADDHPSYGRVVAIFDDGGWQAAMKAAGFEPRTIGGAKGSSAAPAARDPELGRLPGPPSRPTDDDGVNDAPPVVADDEDHVELEVERAVDPWEALKAPAAPRFFVNLPIDLEFAARELLEVAAQHRRNAVYYERIAAAMQADIPWSDESQVEPVEAPELEAAS